MRLAQAGPHPPRHERLGSGTVELARDFDRDTSRAVYTVRFKEAVHVLRAFEKKSETGIKTPQ
jgi:phage-related protein